MKIFREALVFSLFSSLINAKNSVFYIAAFLVETFVIYHSNCVVEFCWRELRLKERARFLARGELSSSYINEILRDLRCDSSRFCLSSVSCLTETIYRV